MLIGSGEGCPRLSTWISASSSNLRKLQLGGHGRKVTSSRYASSRSSPPPTAMAARCYKVKICELQILAITASLERHELLISTTIDNHGCEAMSSRYTKTGYGHKATSSES
ncbi:hypothetical protein NL676_031688 [Syzygium grande]|nr:hypothetical protein NL676_031688 [Syzygium grande]